MYAFIKTFLGLVVIAVICFVCMVIYTLTLKYGIFFFLAVVVLVIAYFIGNFLLDK